MNHWPFYRASDSKVGDVMPCYLNGRFYLYYLRFSMSDGKGCNIWSVRETTDFVTFSEDRRVGIYGGTGEIVLSEGKYHLYKEAEPNVIGHYVGDTPYAFTDTGRRLPPDDTHYVSWAWRDPKIIWVEEEQRYWMLVATNQRTNGSVSRHGCVGLCKSRDLYHWEYCPPLYSPLAYDGTYECPDMFQMGEWYYLVYSNANGNKMTHYVKSKSRYGPWQMPEDDTIDSFLFYAGRTASDGKDRYIAAWNPERTGEDLAMQLGLRDVEQTPMRRYADLAPLGYGGDMVIHKLGQRENGDLTCEPVPAVWERFCRPTPFAITPLQGGEWEMGEKSVTVHSEDGYACALAQALPECCCVEMTIQAQGHEVGIVLGADARFCGQGLFLRLQLGQGRVNVYSALRDRPYVGYCLPFAVEQEKFVRPDSEGCYRVRILQNGELITVYINGTALSLRSEGAQHGHLGFYALHANMKVDGIEVKEAEKIEC